MGESELTQNFKYRVFYAARDGMAMCVCSLLKDRTSEEIEEILNKVSAYFQIFSKILCVCVLWIFKGNDIFCVPIFVFWVGDFFVALLWYRWPTMYTVNCSCTVGTSFSCWCFVITVRFWYWGWRNCQVRWICYWRCKCIMVCCRSRYEKKLFILCQTHAHHTGLVRIFHKLCLHFH